MFHHPIKRPASSDINAWADKLASDGFCVIPNLIDQDAVAALDAALVPIFAATPFCRGGFYGERTKRFGRLLSRARQTAVLVQHELVLGIVETILAPWCDTIQLNLTQAIEIHPGELAQLPHRDQDMWAGEKGRIEYLVNVMWPLTPFRAENGATVLWPESHGAEALGEPPAIPGEAAECDPGSAILFLGSTLHHGGANRTTLPRRGIVAGYSLGWLKTYENQFLAYPPAVARNFSPALAALVGYRQHRPNLGNYEGQCPSILLGDPIPTHLAAIDAVRPDQAAMIGEYVARQRAARTHKPPDA